MSVTTSALSAKVDFSSKLTRSEHKYVNNSGYASFWVSNPNTINLEDATGINTDDTNVIDITFKNSGIARKACHCAKVSLLV